MPLEVFINENESSYFYYEGDNIGPLASKRVRLREVKADMIGYTCELMAKAINQDTLDLPLTAEDKERFVTFLVSEGYLDSADHAYKKNSRARTRRSARLPGACCSRASAIASGPCIEGTGMAPMFQPVGGMDQFPKAFQRKLGDKITLGVEVVSIHQTTDGVKVAYKNVKTGAMTEVTADYCVSCLPLTILQPPRRQSVAGDDGGREGHAVQPEREDGAADEAAVLGGGRQDLRRPPLLEPAVRQLLVSVVGLLRQQGHPARLLRQRPDVGRRQHARSRTASSTC